MGPSKIWGPMLQHMLHLHRVGPGGQCGTDKEKTEISLMPFEKYFMCKSQIQRLSLCLMMDVESTLWLLNLSPRWIPWLMLRIMCVKCIHWLKLRTLGMRRLFFCIQMHVGLLYHAIYVIVCLSFFCNFK